MKKILGSLHLLLLCLPLMAQKADGKQKVKVKKLYSLYGEAYDSFTRLALPAKICLMKKDSTMWIPRQWMSSITGKTVISNLI